MNLPTPPPSQTPYLAHLERIMACVAEGQCCSIVGLSNTGKSTLLRAVHTPPARQRFLPHNSIFFYVDCNLMLTMSEQGFYEATLRAVQTELRSIAPPPPLLERLENFYRKVVEPSSAFVVPLSFNDSVMALCEHLEQRVIFLLDEFDDPFAHLDGRIFLNLRALRDKYGVSLCFVTATEKALSERRSDPDINEFNELFADHTLYLSMLPTPEARLVIAAIGQRSGTTFEDSESDFILAQAGGHPGLLHAVANVLLRVSGDTPTKPDSTLPSPPNLATNFRVRLARQWLESDPVVRSECTRLWHQLNTSEQNLLSELLTQGESVSLKETGQTLINKGIVLDSPTPAVFSPLFEAFARRQLRARLPAQSGVYVDVDSGEVWVDGHQAPTLTELEYRLLLLLYGRIDKICDKYQVVESVWGQEYIDEVDDARIEKLISRLRQKIEGDPSEPRYFQTVRGRGYRLISG